MRGPFENHCPFCETGFFFPSVSTLCLVLPTSWRDIGFGREDAALGEKGGIDRVLKGSYWTSLVRQWHGHDCGGNPMDMIGKTMDGQGSNRTLLDVVGETAWT